MRLTTVLVGRLVLVLVLQAVLQYSCKTKLLLGFKIRGKSVNRTLNVCQIVCSTAGLPPGSKLTIQGRSHEAGMVSTIGAQQTLCLALSRASLPQKCSLGSDCINRCRKADGRSALPKNSRRTAVFSV